MRTHSATSEHLLLLAGVKEERPLVIVGAGGFGREVLDVVNAINQRERVWEVMGFVADDEPDTDVLARIGCPWLGPVGAFLASPSADHYVIGVGDPAARRSVAGQFDTAGLTPALLVHPSATIGADVELGAGSVICSHVSLTTNIRLGHHVHVNLNSTIGHDSRIADFVTINPLVAVSGDVTLQEDVTMGTLSSILQGLHVGAGSFVGAGAVVTKDVAPETTVVGVPAKPIP